MIKRVFPVIAVCVFAAQTGIAIISPIISIYANDLGATALWVGLVYGGYSLSRVFVMPLIGRMTDKHGRRLFVGGGLLLSALISVLYVFADNMPMLFAVRLLHGAVSGAIVPPARAWIAELSPPGHEGRWQGYFNTAFFSGAGAGPLIGGLLSDYFSMDVAFMAMGGLNLLGFLLVTTFLRESSERKIKDRPRVSFRAIGRSRLFQGLFVQRMSKELSIACFIAFMPLYVSTKLDLSLTLIGALLAGNLFISSWLQILTGRVADRFDRRKMVIFGSFTSFTMMLLIPFAANLWQLIGLFFIRALGTSISMPGSAALYVGIGKKQGMGSTIALMGMATSIGLAVGPLLSGVVAEFTEIRSVFFLAAGLGFLGTTTFAILSSMEPKEPAAGDCPPGDNPSK
jgi:MFS transporter, DHA1 family, multidrug resistance protein